MKSGFTPSGLGDSLPLRFVGGLQHDCVILWAVSTFFVTVFIAASCHGVVLWFVERRWAFIDSRASPCPLTFLTEIFASCAERFARCCIHFRTLLPFMCSGDSCLSGLHVEATHDCEFCDTYRLSCEAFFECLHFCSCLSFDPGFVPRGQRPRLVSDLCAH